MSTRQRLGFLAVAAAILIVAVFVIQSGGDDGGAERASDETAATPTATPEPTSAAEEPTVTPEPTPEPTPDPGPVLTASKVTEIEVKKGERVRFRARSASADEVHVHGYDLSIEVQPGRTSRMSFEADIEGIFEIELEHAGTPIGELRVEPR